MALDYFTYSRTHSVTTDKYGVDPLKDKSFEALGNILDYDLYVVKQQDRGRPDNISSMKYGNPNLWWVILYYNGIASFQDIREGITLKIPVMGEVIRIISKNANGNYANKIKTVAI